MKFPTALIVLMLTFPGLNSSVKATSNEWTAFPDGTLFIKNNTNKKLILGFQAGYDAVTHYGSVHVYLKNDLDSAVILQGEFEDKSKDGVKAMRQLTLLPNKAYPCAYMRQKGKILLNAFVGDEKDKKLTCFFLEAKPGGQVHTSSYNQDGAGSTPFRVTAEHAASPDRRNDTLMLSIDPVPGE